MRPWYWSFQGESGASEQTRRWRRPQATGRGDQSSAAALVLTLRYHREIISLADKVMIVCGATAIVRTQSSQIMSSERHMLPEHPDSLRIKWAAVPLYKPRIPSACVGNTYESVSQPLIHSTHGIWHASASSP